MPQVKAEQYVKSNGRRRIWQRIVSALAAVVVFCTTYALILPAITMEQTAFCGLQEHIHDVSCYTPGETLTEQVLICQEPEVPGHSHGEACYLPVHTHTDGCYVQGESELVCTQEETAGHSHSGTRSLICGQEESEAHTHDDSCYSNGCYDEEGQLLCALAEAEEHFHSDACYVLPEPELVCTLGERTEPELICQEPETPGHSHGEACYEIRSVPGEPVLNCDKAEHTHQLMCYSDASADLETEKDWTKDMPEHLSGIWHDDLVTIARLQLGYQESTKNYIVDENGIIRGYTRYGAWYGTPYAEWTETFIRFCLHYAELPAEQIPMPTREKTWSEVLTDAKMYHTEDYAPVPGDLMFMAVGETEEKEVRIGIVLDLSDDGYATAIFGDVDGQVTTGTYHLTDPEITGFAQLPDNTQEETVPETTASETVPEETVPETTVSETIPDETVPETTVSETVPEETTPDRQVTGAIALIDALPSADEVETKLAAYEAAEDWDGYKLYYTQIGIQGREAYQAYANLNAAQQEQVTNVQKLWDLEWLWSAATLEEPVEQSPEDTTVYYCGLEAHTHTAANGCYDQVGNLTCAQTVHEHTAQCEIAPVYYCGLEAHSHSESCASDCAIPVHVHDSDCLIAPVYYCGMEDDPDHTHNETCLISPYQCGLEAHLHDADCPDDCAAVEHVHTESCKETPGYQCGKTDHQHSDACYDAEGALVCGQEAHTHTSDCLVVYYCGIVHEHVHDGCYDNFVHKCGKIGHTHFYLCTVKPQYCDETHIHNSDCYDENGILTCSEHTHILSCWINPASSGTSTDQEDLFAGSNRFHSNYFLKYQASGHTVSSYEIGTFVLIPESANVDGWVPNTRQWSGSSNANYLVAYCSDDRTSASKKGEAYETYTLDTSRFSDDDQRRKIAAIIGHSYPFLTADEMREQLRLAYEQGLTVDGSGNVIDVTDCTESDWIAATQWAIWDTTSTFGTHPSYKVDIDDYGAARPAEIPSQAEFYCVNPLSDPGHTDIATSRVHLEAIHNWLMSLQEPVALAVQSYDYQISENSDGSYKLDVTVTLNRETVSGEHTVFQLSVGSKSTVINKLQVGQTQFAMELDGISLEEIASARVYLNVDGKHMQAYFFDSANYQDMVGGNWEYYSEDLSFDLTADKTDVTVYKKWTESVPTTVKSVTVQLYADGKPYGDPIQLSAANSWTHTWKDLNKSHISGVNADGSIFGGEAIVYTIVETPIPGYYSSLTQVEEFGNDADAEDITVTYWKEVDSFEGDGEYVLLSKVGALTASDFKNKYYMNVSPIDLGVVADDQAKTVWVATGSAETGYKLANKYYPTAYMGNEVITTSTSSARNYFFEDGLLFFKGTSQNSYFRSFYSNGYQVYTADSSLAMTFRLYKLTTEKLPSSQINFLLTNTQIPEETQTQVSVTKQWTGRRDSKYPLSATVTLLQNGRPYGDPVILDETNNWTYIWESLPYQMNGEVIQYSVQEEPTAGYEASLEIQDNTATDDPFLAITLTNTWKPTLIPIDVRKADATNAKVLLPGAVFDVYVVDTAAEQAQLIPGTNTPGISLGSLETPESGTVSMEFEVGETYYLFETMAPKGYNLLTEPIVVTVTETGLTVSSGADWAQAEDSRLTIMNQPGYILPETGGIGTTLYTTAGLLLILSAVILLFMKKRGKEAYS